MALLQPQSAGDGSTVASLLRRRIHGCLLWAVMGPCSLLCAAMGPRLPPMGSDGALQCLNGRRWVGRPLPRAVIDPQIRVMEVCWLNSAESTPFEPARINDAAAVLRRLNDGAHALVSQSLGTFLHAAMINPHRVESSLVSNLFLAMRQWAPLARNRSPTSGHEVGGPPPRSRELARPSSSETKLSGLSVVVEAWWSSAAAPLCPSNPGRLPPLRLRGLRARRAAGTRSRRCGRWLPVLRNAPHRSPVHSLALQLVTRGFESTGRATGPCCGLTCKARPN